MKYRSCTSDSFSEGKKIHLCDEDDSDYESDPEDEEWCCSMWSEPFELDLPEGNDVSIYMIEESEEGSIPYLICSTSSDQMESLIDQVFSYYTDHCSLKVTRMTSRYNDGYPDMVEVSPAIKQACELHNSSIDDLDSDMFLVCIDRVGNVKYREHIYGFNIPK